jgi:hypothetical protein
LVRMYRILPTEEEIKKADAANRRAIEAANAE